MGPKLFSKKSKSGTEFKIKLIPLGGYVRMAGEDPKVIETLPEEEQKQMYYSKKPWQRFLIAFGGPLFSFLAGYIILALASAIWGLPSVGISYVDYKSPAFEAGFKPGDVVSKANGIYIFGFDDFSSIIRKNDLIDVELLRNGEEINLQIRPEILAEQVNMILETEEFNPSLLYSQISSINGIKLNEFDFKANAVATSNTPFADREVLVQFSAGESVKGILRSYEKYPERKGIGIVYATLSNRLKSTSPPFSDGDRITAINGSAIKEGADFFKFLSLLNFPSSKKEKYMFLEARGGIVLEASLFESSTEISITIEKDGKSTDVSLSKQDFINILSNSIFYPPQENWYPQNTFSAFWIGILRANNLLGRMGEIIANLFTGQTKASDFSGPLGIVTMVGQASKAGLETIIIFVALITLNLGLFNLLPLPALDGGRIVFNVIEMISRKKINPVIEGYIHAVGFFILIGFLIYVTYFDIIRFLN